MQRIIVNEIKIDSLYFQKVLIITNTKTKDKTIIKSLTTISSGSLKFTTPQIIGLENNLI